MPATKTWLEGLASVAKALNLRKAAGRHFARALIVASRDKRICAAPVRPCSSAHPKSLDVQGANNGRRPPGPRARAREPRGRLDGPDLHQPQGSRPPAAAAHARRGAARRGALRAVEPRRRAPPGRCHRRRGARRRGRDAAAVDAGLDEGLSGRARRRAVPGRRRKTRAGCWS